MPAHIWQRSTYCAQGEACVHMATHNGTVRLTESGDPSGAILRTTPAALDALLRTLKEDRLHD
ncbi:DUF397 domain-containing protein [Streptomyces sp. NPDC002932]|uniref:DUF397 domain-containing protein n=1 Tax=Streptomyces sp. NPDC002932 TaxID=3364672 RepID=UPI0036BD4B78